MNSFHLGNIRKLLIEGFTSSELRDFCYDHSDFRPVYDRLAENTGKDEIVRQLVEYADQRELLEPLLNWGEEQNPKRFEEYQYKIGVDASRPIRQNSVKTKGKKSMLKNPVFWAAVGAIATIVSVIVALIFGIISLPEPDRMDHFYFKVQVMQDDTFVPHKSVKIQVGGNEYLGTTDTGGVATIKLPSSAAEKIGVLIVSDDGKVLYSNSNVLLTVQQDNPFPVQLGGP